MFPKLSVDRSKRGNVSANARRLFLDPEAYTLVNSEIHRDLKLGNLLVLGYFSGDGSRSRKLGQNETRVLRLAVQSLDLLLEPEEAEGAIGDLIEGYLRRRSVGRTHAKRWLWAQTFRIVFYRGIDLLGRVRGAWAGK